MAQRGAVDPASSVTGWWLFAGVLLHGARDRLTPRT